MTVAQTKAARRRIIRANRGKRRVSLKEAREAMNKEPRGKRK